MAASALDVTDQSAPIFQVYSAKDGLSDEIWSNVDFDAQGFVWAGSASSLARFDGYRWTIADFPEARSLVRDMHQDRSGTLWAIFEREGLARYDGKHWQLTGHTTFAHRFSHTLLPDGRQQDWVAQAGAIAALNGGALQIDVGSLALPAGTTIKFERSERLFGGPREWLVRSPGQIWFRKADVASAESSWQRFEHPELNLQLPTDLVRTFDRGVEELWFLAYGSGIYRLREDGLRHWSAAQGELPSEAIYSALATYGDNGERTLWVATRAGLLRIRGDEVRVFDRRHGLPSNAVRGIEIQRDLDGADMLWLATEGGIARALLSSSQWQTVSLLGASENGIFGVLLEPNGRGGERLWVGSAREGIGLLDDGHWRYFTAAQGAIPEESVRAIWRLPGPDGQSWRLVSFMGGSLQRIDDALQFTPVAVPWPAVGGEAATAALSRTVDGRTELWFGTFRSGIHRYADGRWTSFPETGGTQPWSVHGFAEQVDSAGQSVLWAAGSEGLARLVGARFELLPASQGLPEDGYRGVRLIQEGTRSVLWASSNRHGVVRVDVTDPERPRLLEDAAVPPAPDPTVYSVHEDSKGRIYVCTNNGVQQLTPRAGGGYEERVFRRHDGLVHDECNSNGQQIDALDRYWVGTLAGLSVFNPDIKKPAARKQTRPLHFTEARIDGMLQGIVGAAGIQLPAGKHELRVNYALLTGLREEESSYRSQLLGYEEQPGPWTLEHGRTFSALPPGEYTLRVEGRDYQGAAGETTELAITVAALWWQRAPVQWLGGILLLSAAVFLVLLYNRQLRQRQRVLQQTVAEQTAELHTANARLTELSYRDPLTGIANRRRLMEAIEAALDRARAQQLPLGLIVLDVDHFKDFNDRYGHLAGDIALRAVAKAIDSASRGQDLVARFGGEEFACLLLDADIESVQRIAERMRALVEALPPRAIGSESQTLTVSAGIASRVPAAGEGAAELLQIADNALYQAKRNGRNQVCGGPPP